MFSQPFLTLISGGLIGGVAAYLGTLMLAKKMSVITDPLAHLAFPGVAIALILGWSIFLGAFPFVIIGVFLIWLLEKKTKLPLENLTAIIFSFGVGLALLILPIEKAEEALVGNIAFITPLETLVTIILSILIFYVVSQIYNKIMLMNVYEDLAAVEGINTRLYSLIYLLSIAIVVSLGVYLAGGLMTAALIAIPSASAKNISHNLASYKKWSVFFGILASILGIVIAPLTHLPIGPSVIIVGVIIFLISIIFKKEDF
jgi:ABC-type Mn2+/Zn2+ transport system permease subunit